MPYIVQVWNQDILWPSGDINCTPQLAGRADRVKSSSVPEINQLTCQENKLSSDFQTSDKTRQTNKLASQKAIRSKDAISVVKENEITVVKSEFVGFQTAAGCRVEISDEALAKAKLKLDSFQPEKPDCNSEDSRRKLIENKRAFNGKRKSVNISDKALSAAETKMKALNMFLPSAVSKCPDLKPSEGSLLRVTKVAGRSAKSENPMSEAMMQNFNPDRIEIPDYVIEPELKSEVFVGFHTAAGKQVNISEKALSKAKAKMENFDIKETEKIGVNSSDPKPNEAFVGFQTAAGKQVNISEKAVSEARAKLEYSINEKIQTETRATFSPSLSDSSCENLFNNKNVLRDDFHHSDCHIPGYRVFVRPANASPHNIYKGHNYWNQSNQN